MNYIIRCAHRQVCRTSKTISRLIPCEEITEVSYNPTFRLNPKQLALIEDALRSEMSRTAKLECQKSVEEAKELNDLLAHLHHQKSWYKPKQPVPLG
jgi:hypothetical protein